MSFPPLLASETSMKRRALLFVLPVVLAVAALAAAIAYRQGALETFDQVTFVADTATGITKGMPVKLKGLSIGVVQDVLPRAGSAANELVMQVHLLINRRHTRYVASDAPVSLAQDGLIGQSYLDIGVGKSPRAIANGEALVYLRKRSLKELADGLSDDTAPILRDLGAFAKSLGDPDGDARRMLQSARETVAMVPQVTQRTLKVLGEADATIVSLRNQSSASLAQTTQLLQRADALLTKVDDAAPQLLQSAGATLANTERASTAASRIVADSEAPLRALLSKGEQGADTAVEILEGATQTWPVNTLLPARGYRSALPEAAVAPGIVRPRKETP